MGRKYTNMKESRIGEEKYNNFGSLMKIVEYRSCRDIDILFVEYDYVVKNKEYGNFKKGNIKCPYEPTVCGIGCLGENAIAFKDGKGTDDCYSHWRGMLMRCYDQKYLQKYPTYIDCTVCEDWLNFSNFQQWYNKNYYEIPGETMCLDKDILVKGNKVYSPDTCIFVLWSL